MMVNYVRVIPCFTGFISDFYNLHLLYGVGDRYVRVGKRFWPIPLCMALQSGMIVR